MPKQSFGWRLKIEEKKLRSPIKGVVVKIHKQPAELIGGIDQQPFMTIVQLDPLKAVFHLPPDVAGRMQPGEQIDMDTGNEPVIGKIDYISPYSLNRNIFCQKKGNIKHGPEIIIDKHGKIISKKTFS